MHSSRTNQDHTDFASELRRVDLHHRRRRLGRIRLFGFSPVTHILFILGSFIAIIYLLRDPLDRLLPGFKDQVESAMNKTSHGVTRTADWMSTSAGRLYGTGAGTVMLPAGKPAPGPREVRLPYSAQLRARPRIAIPKSPISRSARPRECGEGCYVLEMADNSMEPTIKKGESLLIDSRRRPAPGDIVCAKYEGNPYLRRFFPTDSVVRLAPENPSFPDIRLARKEAHLDGVLVRILGPDSK